MFGILLLMSLRRSNLCLLEIMLLKFPKYLKLPICIFPMLVDEFDSSKEVDFNNPFLPTFSIYLKEEDFSFLLIFYFLIWFRFLARIWDSMSLDFKQQALFSYYRRLDQNKYYFSPVFF